MFIDTQCFGGGISRLHARAELIVCHLSASHTHTHGAQQIKPLADLFHQRCFMEDDWQAWFVICMAVGFIRCCRCRNLSTDEWTPLLAQMHWIFRFHSCFSPPPLLISDLLQKCPWTLRSYSKAQTHFSRALLTRRFCFEEFFLKFFHFFFFFFRSCSTRWRTHGCLFGIVTSDKDRGGTG